MILCTACSAAVILHQMVAGFGDRSLIRAHVRGDRDLTYLRFTAPPRANRFRLTWEQTVFAGAFRDRLHAATTTEYPLGTHFASPPEPVFRARLATAARRWHFRVLDARYLQPLQGAPMIVVQTRNPRRLARESEAVRQFLDWRSYEGFYFEAEDAHNERAFAFSDALRGTNQGSEWARSEPLYPFEHL